jgi:hypothetical protein
VVIKLDPNYNGFYSFLPLRSSGAKVAATARGGGGGGGQGLGSRMKVDPKRKFLVKIQAPLGPIIPVSNMITDYFGKITGYLVQSRGQAACQPPNSTSDLVC